MKICKYYQEIIDEIPLGPYGKNIIKKHKCNKEIIYNNGETVGKIRDCRHFKDFEKCEYFEKE